ncbi:DUF4430 domain-containing protein [Methanolobus sp. ZRKC1]|uniref:DUF4430 domain-containing protein n=1 Tax=Methanolobus sp. ZRKC1 TaxID=3125781 RepID=UPI003246C036
MRKLSLMLLMTLACVAVLASPAMAGVVGERTINTSTVNPGETFEVTVSLTATGTSMRTAGILEDLPDHWILTTIDNDGLSHVIEDGNHTWVDESGSTLDPAVPVTIVYDVTVPENATAGTYSITGLVKAMEDVGGSFDMCSNTTEGDNSVTIAAASVVHINEGDDYKTKIENAADGATIYWHEGTYSGDDVSLPDNVHIIGDGKDVVDASTVDLTGGNDSEIEGMSLHDIGDGENTVNLTVKDSSLHSFDAIGIVLVENCTFSGYQVLLVGSYSGSFTFKNNTLTNAGLISASRFDSIEVSGNVFQNLSSTSMMNALIVSDTSDVVIENNIVTNYYGMGNPVMVKNCDDVVIRGNFFESTSTLMAGSSPISVSGDATLTLYLNNFIDCSEPYVRDVNDGTVSLTWHSPEAIDYTYQGNSYSSILGNYYDTYTGSDADGDGIGDSSYSPGASGTDEYPLMAAFSNGEIESELFNELYSGNVTVMETDIDFTASDSSETYPVSQRTCLGALLESGVEYYINDDSYADYGSFYLESIGGIEAQSWPGASWGIYVNGEATDYGLGLNSVSDGDVVSFYYAPWDTETFAQDLDKVFYSVSITVNDETPIDAQRTIKYQTFNVDSDQYNSTLVTVTITANEYLEALYLIETVPSDWILTSADEDGALFRESDDPDTYEWMWAGSMNAGDSKTIKYVIQYPAGESLDDYEFDGVVSAYVNNVDVDDINVLGDSSIELTEDWNPWDDIGSEEDEVVTGSELQEAIKCWINKIDIPQTGAEMTSDRMQEVIHLWLIQ